MSGAFLAVAGTLIMVLALLGGLWIPFAIGGGGLLILYLAEGPSAFNSLGFVVWGSMNSSTLSSVPLFILMAEILLRSGVSGRFYDGLSTITWLFPGGLLQSNIAGSALFSAISGSSVATAAAIGGVALPRLRDEGYDMKMATGSIAAGGTLGILIPPSIPLIIYASFTEISVAKLFMAAILPGLLMTALFMLYIAARSYIDPDIAPKAFRPKTLRAYLVGMARVFPVLVIIGFVLGTIYFGIATATESAAVGCAVSFAIAAIVDRVPVKVYVDAVIHSVKVSASILMIACAAYIFAYAIETTGVADQIAKGVLSLNMNFYLFLFALFVMYAVLGCLVDSIGMIVLTVPLLIPILNAMGVDLIWFGVALVVVVELGQITPPMGINLFVVNAISKVQIGQIVRGVWPYYLLVTFFLVIFTIFPSLALWLPSTL